MIGLVRSLMELQELSADDRCEKDREPFRAPTTSWTLNLDTFDLVDPEGRTDFSHDEFARQDWPPCPACGRTILADRMPTPATVDGPECYRSAVLQGSGRGAVVRSASRDAHPAVHRCATRGDTISPRDR